MNFSTTSAPVAPTMAHMPVNFSTNPAAIDATALLCRVLEQDKAEFNGQALVDLYPEAAHQLLRERILVLGHTLEWIICPDCRTEQARVVRELSQDRVLLRCIDCEDFDAPSLLRQTWKVPLPRFINSLLTGLNLSPLTLKAIEPDLSWRLGHSEPARGRMLTWYFARHLHRPEVAYRLREQIALERTTASCIVLTSSEVPLPLGSPLMEFDVRSLHSVARLSQSRLEFICERIGPSGMGAGEDLSLGDGHSPNVPLQGSTLRHVRSQGKAVVEGVEYELEPRQRALLLALMDDRDHEMDKAALKTACGSQAQIFSPSKEFLRNPYVYSHFIRYLRDEARYALQIPEQDRHWLP
jgi:hypothetical protein